MTNHDLATLITLGILMWIVLGFYLWLEVTGDLVDEDDLSYLQLIIYRIIAGPVVWLYSIWQLLGLFGKRK